MRNSLKLKRIKIGVECNHVRLDESVSEAELIDHVRRLNDDPLVHGIIVQFPLPTNISEVAISSALATEKDVDAFGPINAGRLAQRRGLPRYIPCTARGIMVLLQGSGVELSGKRAVVIGRSDIVGIPVSVLLRNADATVTVCHSKTRDLEDIVRQGDIVVVAIGQPELVRGSWIKSGAVVIDVGINYVPDSSTKSGFKLVGDVHYPSVAELASLITPVPGGVGPMTVAMLLNNVVDAALAANDGL